MDEEAVPFINSMKMITEKYINNRKLSEVRMGIYDGNAIVINDQLAIPMEMIRGPLISLLVGEKVELLRNEGGREYYIMKIIGSPEDMEHLDSSEDMDNLDSEGR